MELQLDRQLARIEADTEIISKYFDKRNEKLTIKATYWTPEDELELMKLRSAYEKIVERQNKSMGIK